MFSALILYFEYYRSVNIMHCNNWIIGSLLINCRTFGILAKFHVAAALNNCMSLLFSESTDVIFGSVHHIRAEMNLLLFDAVTIAAMQIN